MGTSEPRRTARIDRKVDGGAPAARAVPKDSEARERILTTAYGLFCRHGIGAVGVDTIIDQSGVAKMTLYRHFRSKDDLVLAVLERREELWTQAWLVTDVKRRASDPAERLLAIFDVFDGWFRRRSFEGCLFVNALLEIEDRKHPIHQASREQLAPGVGLEPHHSVQKYRTSDGGLALDGNALGDRAQFQFDRKSQFVIDVQMDAGHFRFLESVLGNRDPVVSHCEAGKEKDAGGSRGGGAFRTGRYIQDGDACIGYRRAGRVRNRTGDVSGDFLGAKASRCGNRQAGEKQNYDRIFLQEHSLPPNLQIRAPTENQNVSF
jgi:AcrR family transcriptional regulator